MNFLWWKRKTLEDYITETKVIFVKGIRFEVKKVDIANYLQGLEVALQVYDTHINAKAQAKAVPPPEEKTKKHIKHVVVAGCVSPAFSITKEPGLTCIEDVTFDWDLLLELYGAIIELTYGKKKVKQALLAGKSS